MGQAHCRRWTAAAFRMSLAVRGELGFKASRSIRRLLGKQTGPMLEPPRPWGPERPSTLKQDAGSSGWGCPGWRAKGPASQGAGGGAGITAGGQDGPRSPDLGGGTGPQRRWGRAEDPRAWASGAQRARPGSAPCAGEHAGKAPSAEDSKVRIPLRPRLPPEHGGPTSRHNPSPKLKSGDQRVEDAGGDGRAGSQA